MPGRFEPGPRVPERGRVSVPGASQPAPQAPSARPTLRRWLWTGGLTLLFLLGGIVVAAGLDLEIGIGATCIGLVTALLPLAIVVPAVLWLDRFEAEPTRYLLTTFLWGACVATAGAMVFNTSSLFLLSQLTTHDDAERMAATMVAPVVEESLKGLGVLLVLLVRRREFDGVVDGIVYAAMTAAGFAFAENVLYLGRGYGANGAAGLAVVLVVRGIFGPFAHPLFTACTGVGLGLAATRSRGAFRFVAPVVGLAAAIGLHAFWNLTAFLGAQGSLTLYLMLQLPIFLAACGFAIWARRREARLLTAELAGYARAGWLSAPEVSMLGDLDGRRQAVRWARRRGGAPAVADMKRLQDQAVELAMLRSRMRRGTASPDAPAQEASILHELTGIRGRLYGGHP